MSANVIPAVPDTGDVLQGMLTQNTGTHFLDSGGAYGRNWEGNQGVKFDELPTATLKGEVWKSGSCLNVTKSVYHFLKERLTYDHGRTQGMNAYANRPENEDEGWGQLVEGWAKKRRDGEIGKPVEIGGIYGEGEPFWRNTSNYDSLLDQVIQFYYWTEGEFGDRTTYVALQIHGGCDVRGGYTDPVIFEVDDSEGIAILDDNRGTIRCDECDQTWDTDDAYHWYDQGKGGSGTGTIGQLDEFPMVNAKTDEGDKVPRPGVIFVGEDGQCHCPGCGTGKLLAHGG